MNEYYNLTTIENVSSFTVLSSNNPAPTPILLANTAEVNQEKYEGVLVTVQNATCTKTAGFGEWHLYDGSDTCRVDGDVYWYNSPQVTYEYDVTGVVSYNYNHFKLNPRNLADINETASAPINTSIYQIQHTTLPSGASPLVGYNVIVEGVVTAKNAPGVDRSYYIQDSSEVWNGIMILNDTAHVAVVGDKIRITASVKEEFNLTVLKNVTAYTVLSSNNPAPTPILLANTAEINQEKYEGVLVRVEDANCTFKGGFGEWHLYDGSDTCRVDGDVYWYNSAKIGYEYDVTGVVSYNYNKFRLNPRDLLDINETVSIEELNNTNSFKIYPNPSNNVLNIKMNDFAENSLLNIYSMQGQILKSVILNNNLTSLDISSLSNGNYIIQIMNGSTISQTKFSKF